VKKTVFITGATSGFGKACAEKFAANQYNVIITGRRQDRLESLKTELEKKFSVEVLTLCFDVQRKEQVFTSIEGLSGHWKKVDVLINNAGLALGRDLFESASLDDWETMIDTNVKGLLYVSRAILPSMIAAGSGLVINIGSTAAKEVYEKGNVYCASKFAVDAISKAMRIDLLPHQIKVTAIHPGAAETEFSLIRFKHDKVQAEKIYEGYEPLHAADIAEAAFFCAQQPAHVCVNELIITCTAQANSYYTYKSQ
jgi:3-hydroxy acid dehydrogenase / malonic semialdehyde reductase